MSAPPKSMSLDEFIAWEEAQELRCEYDGIAVFAMTGGSNEHARIQANLIRALGNRLAGGPCFVLGGELKVRTATSIRYLDALVHCSPIPARTSFAPAPVVSFEIVSPSSARRDLGVNNPEYRSLPSVKR